MGCRVGEWNGLGNGLIPPEAKPPLTEATTAAECKLSGLEALLAEGSSPMTILAVFVLIDVFMVFCRCVCVIDVDKDEILILTLSISYKKFFYTTLKTFFQKNFTKTTPTLNRSAFPPHPTSHTDRTGRTQYTPQTPQSSVLPCSGVLGVLRLIP